ncbi:hypothetical protein ACWD3I_40865 [Streptomyces sp. NPDC002817]|uniref:hypothetical protein n=1 Tax=Streptomyces sp. NPDC088357 TaxID=3154655 RepID=UPI0034287088
MTGDDAVRAVGDLVRGAGGGDASAAHAAAGTEIDHDVGFGVRVAVRSVALEVSAPGEQQAQAVEQFDRGPEPAVHLRNAGLLPPRERGRHMLDTVNGRGRGLAQTAPKVGGQGLHKTPAPLHVQHTEGEQGLARPAGAGDRHELAQGPLTPMPLRANWR